MRAAVRRIRESKTMKIKLLPTAFAFAAFAGLFLGMGGTALPLPAAQAQEVAVTTPAAAPALVGGTWASGKPASLAALKGKVVLVAFWTRGCINCKRVLPYWNDWAVRTVRSNDSAVVSVHTPETPGERSVQAVKRFAQEKNLRFPILIDNDAKNWDAFGIQAWPTTILLDKQGRARAKWEGELNWDNSGDHKRVEQAIEKLRKEK